MNARSVVPVLTFVSCLALGTGCSSTERTCIPGQQIACACPGGGQGAQACNAEGSGYGTCQGCTSPVPDAGGGVAADAGAGEPSDASAVEPGRDASAGADAAKPDVGAVEVDAGEPDAGLQEITIPQINQGTAPQKVEAALPGVVAMSKKFLLAQNKTTGSCLWGAFVSAPGLTETAEYTGLLVASYGTPAIVDPSTGIANCPVLGRAAAGDAMPDDLKPGDVLNLIGKPESYAPPCSVEPLNLVPQYRLSCTVATRTGTTSVPTPHTLAGADVVSLSSLTDSAFHARWGGVKVRVTNVQSTPQNGNFTDQFGNFVLAESGLKVGDRIYYQGLLKSSDPMCHAAPTQPKAATEFSVLDGFSFLDYCTWMLEPGDRCADSVPNSPDCTSATACK